MGKLGQCKDAVGAHRIPSSPGQWLTALGMASHCPHLYSQAAGLRMPSGAGRKGRGVVPNPDPQPRKTEWVEKYPSSPGLWRGAVLRMTHPTISQSSPRDRASVAHRRPRLLHSHVGCLPPPSGLSSPRPHWCSPESLPHSTTCLTSLTQDLLLEDPPKAVFPPL